MGKKARDVIGELAEIIKSNPGCFAEVDNDCWTLFRASPEDIDTADDYEEVLKDLEIASSDTHSDPFGGYGSGNCYGGDLLQALARIVGIRVESV
jgi:hypothetical protein